MDPTAAVAAANLHISAHVDACGRAFISLAAALTETPHFASQTQPETINGEFDRFKIWAGNIAAHRKGRRSLEYRLRDAAHLKDEAHNLLKALQEALADALAIVKGERTPWDELSSSDSDSGSETSRDEGDVDFQNDTELKQLSASIKNTVTCLFRLSMAIRDPAPNDQSRNFITVDKSYFENHDTLHVQSKFPEAKAWLTERLGRAISGRRQYLTYREEHHQKLTKNVEMIGVEAPRTMHTTNSTEASPLPVTGLKAANVMDVLDDGVDTLSQTSYATSVNATIRAPRLPKEAKEKGHFECPFCYMIVSIHTTSGWKQHVYRDLHPFCCTFEHCTTADRLYDSRRAWFTHELGHKISWQCIEGCDKPFNTEKDFVSHVHAQHPDLAEPNVLSALKQTATKSANILSHTACSLCNKKMTLRALQKHLGHHQEQLALFALPPNLDDTEDDLNNDDDSIAVDVDKWQDEELSDVSDAVDVSGELESDEVNADGSSVSESPLPNFPRISRKYLDEETLFYHNIPFKQDRTDPEYLILLEELEESYMDVIFEHTKRLREQRDARPTYIKILRKYVDTRSLDHYSLPWEVDPTDPEYFIVAQYVDNTEIDVLFEHTKRLREAETFDPQDDSNRLVNARVARKHVEERTLEAYHIRWEIDDSDPDYYVLHQPLGTKALKVIFEHTRKLRQTDSDLDEEPRTRRSPTPPRQEPQASSGNINEAPSAIPWGSTPKTPLGKIAAIALHLHTEIVPPASEFMKNPPLDEATRWEVRNSLADRIEREVTSKLDPLEAEGDEEVQYRYSILRREVHDLLIRLALVPNNALSIGDGYEAAMINASTEINAPAAFKHVGFELLRQESSQYRALGINIEPHMATESIIELVKSFYELHDRSGLLFQNHKGKVLDPSYETLSHDMVVYVRLLPEDAPPSIHVAEDEDNGIIKCICGNASDDGNTVLCELCNTWQHIGCYYESIQQVPDIHECASCVPRSVFGSEAQKRQLMLREQQRRIESMQESSEKSKNKGKERARDAISTDPPDFATVSDPVNADHHSVVETLLRAGADVNAPSTRQGRTPLHIAAEMGSRDIFQRLSKAGADVNAPSTRQGRTPLHIAAEMGSRDIFQRLSKAGADVNASSYSAAEMGSVELVKNAAAKVNTARAMADHDTAQDGRKRDDTATLQVPGEGVKLSSESEAEAERHGRDTPKEAAPIRTQGDSGVYGSNPLETWACDKCAAVNYPWNPITCSNCGRSREPTEQEQGNKSLKTTPVSEVMAIAPLTVGEAYENSDYESTAEDALPMAAESVERTNDQNLSYGWVEALGVDPNYQPPSSTKHVPIPAEYDEDDSFDEESEEMTRNAWKSLRATRELKEEQRLESLRQKAEADAEAEEQLGLETTSETIEPIERSRPGTAEDDDSSFSRPPTTTGSQLATSDEADVQKPVVHADAMSYVNRVKHRFASQPDVYRQFLVILQTYEREGKPIQEVYTQVTSLFSSEPDLVEDFKRFLPESAAQRRAQKNPAVQSQSALPGPGAQDSQSQLAQSNLENGPVDHSAAISYLNKVKSRFASQPGIYNRFLTALHAYQQKYRPIHDVYAEVTSLLSTAPDLLEDLKLFLPESPAQSRAHNDKQQIDLPRGDSVPAPFGYPDEAVVPFLGGIQDDLTAGSSQFKSAIPDEGEARSMTEYEKSGTEPSLFSAGGRHNYEQYEQQVNLPDAYKATGSGPSSDADTVGKGPPDDGSLGDLVNPRQLDDSSQEDTPETRVWDVEPMGLGPPVQYTRRMSLTKELVGSSIDTHALTPQQQASKFREQDNVQNPIIENGVRTGYGRFVVGKGRPYHLGGHWEYQLLDSNGQLFRDGAWISEKDFLGDSIEKVMVSKNVKSVEEEEENARIIALSRQIKSRSKPVEQEAALSISTSGSAPAEPGQNLSDNRLEQLAENEVSKDGSGKLDGDDPDDSSQDTTSETRVWPGMHQQRAQQVAISKAQAQMRQQLQQFQQQNVQQTTSAVPSTSVSAPDDLIQDSFRYLFEQSAENDDLEDGISELDFALRYEPEKRPNDESRVSRDYRFTIASPDEEMHGKAIALFDLARENDNELPLVKGQVILVSYRHGQGWLVAQNPKTGESGLVPEEYVRLLRDSSL